jgi:hypothetical protein
MGLRILFDVGAPHDANVADGTHAVMDSAEELPLAAGRLVLQAYAPGEPSPYVAVVLFDAGSSAISN